jgi:DNA-3-methyladenine glycosylase I
VINPENNRCAWAKSDPLMCAYHDEEWGVPDFDSRSIWECLALEGFQAGLAWIVVLRKRRAFRAAFKQFDPEKVARFGAEDISKMLENPGIIRSRSKNRGDDCRISDLSGYAAGRNRLLRLGVAFCRRQADSE